MEQSGDLIGKNVVVTGAGSGIGRAIAIQAAARGARVVVSDVHADGIAATVAAIGPAAIPVMCDIADHDQVAELAAQAVSALGRIDMVFANAGVIASGKLLTMPNAEVDWILGVNLRGTWSTVAHFGRIMVGQESGGALCITGSEHSLGFQHAGAGIYTASKHAVLGMADVLRAELPAHVRVSVLCPGLVATALGNVPRPAGLPAVRGNPEASRRVQARGSNPDDIARQAIDGVLRGDFLIVTHAHAVLAARRRLAEIEQAFADQAPWYEGAEQMDVNRVLADVAAEMKGA